MSITVLSTNSFRNMDTVIFIFQQEKKSKGNLSKGNWTKRQYNITKSDLLLKIMDRIMLLELRNNGRRLLDYNITKKSKNSLNILIKFFYTIYCLLFLLLIQIFIMEFFYLLYCNFIKYINFILDMSFAFFTHIYSFLLAN